MISPHETIDLLRREGFADHADALAAEVTYAGELREALAYYADPGAWKQDAVGGGRRILTEGDNGQRARAALTQNVPEISQTQAKCPACDSPVSPRQCGFTDRCVLQAIPENEKSHSQSSKPEADRQPAQSDEGLSPAAGGRDTTTQSASGEGHGIGTFDALRQVTAALESLFALVNGEAPSLLRDDHHYTMAVEAIEAGNEALKVPAISNARIIEGENAIDVLDAARERLYMLVLERAGPRPVPIERLIALVEEEFRARNVPSLGTFPRLQPPVVDDFTIEPGYLRRLKRHAAAMFGDDFYSESLDMEQIEQVLLALETFASQGNVAACPRCGARVESIGNPCPARCGQTGTAEGSVR